MLVVDLVPKNISRKLGNQLGWCDREINNPPLLILPRVKTGGSFLSPPQKVQPSFDGSGNTLGLKGVLADRPGQAFQPGRGQDISLLL